MKRPSKLVVLVLLGLLLVMAAGGGFFLVQHRTAPVTPTEHVPTTWQTARETPMHTAHVERGKVACASCHVSGFAEKPAEAVCTSCHADASAKAHRGDATAPTTCLTCHVFGAEKAAATCVGCHGPTTADGGHTSGLAGGEAARSAHELAAHVSKEAACASCHDAHGTTKKGARPRVALADCTACHTSVTVQHGSVRGPSAAASASAREGDAGESFDAAVARFAADTRAATALRDGGGGETAQVCAACHAPHTKGATAREACASCHVAGARAGADAGAHAGGNAHASGSAGAAGEVMRAAAAPRIEPRGKNVAGHAACVTCHAPHQVAKAETRRCEDCHADHRGATAVAGHAACTGCHTPHAPAEAKASCASAGCHAGKVALAAPRVAAHAACASCHDPHQPAASPALACVRCHESVQPKHPAFASKTAAASTCIGCHAPHESNAKTKAKAAASTTPGATAAACSSCHTKARNDRAMHAGGVACVACHTPHDFATNLLRTATGAPAHGVAAPSAKAEEAALCAQCHAPKAAAVAARPGHAECGTCHGAPHSPVKKPACAPCHAQETASAPKGHAACTQCHDAHSGSLGTHASCTSCHAEKPKQQHGSLPGACATCHVAHGPKGVTKPPACASCHGPAKLAGLHANPAHAASCASCHSSHAPPRSDRATCTSSCHADRREHQPAAQVCKGCHMFRN